MWNATEVRQALAGLPLGAVHIFQRVGSTNDEAARLAEAGAPHATLVLADEQTAGRGRAGRRWFTPPGSALALSLVLRPVIHAPPGYVAALGALAVCEALEAFGAQPTIKWPNDVLLLERKVAGVLPEAHWEGERLRFLVLGIGVNVTPEAVPPPEALDFPAIAVQEALARPVERLSLLRALMTSLLSWADRLDTPTFRRAWEARLAWHGRMVEAHDRHGPPVQGILLGLDAEGHLRLRDVLGREHRLTAYAHVRPR